MDRFLFTLTALSCLLSVAPVGAQNRPASCAMAYAQFEAAIPHVDLEACPIDVAPTGSDRFCRATAGGESVHVFAFDFAGEKCLAAMKSFDKDAFKLTIGK